MTTTTSLVTILLLTLTVPSARAQPVAIVVDGGIAQGGATDLTGPDEYARASGFGGITAQTNGVDLGRGWDISAGAALRREPVLAMARTPTRVTPAYFDATSAAVFFRVAQRSRSLESALVGRFAETRLDRGQPVQRAVNTIGDWSFLVEATMELRWYGARGIPARASERTLSTIVRGYVGAKHDQRLHRAADLQPFDDPTGRLEGGFFVTPWRYRNARGEGLLAVEGGAEIAAAIRGGDRLPSGWRTLVRAEVDVRRVLNGWR